MSYTRQIVSDLLETLEHNIDRERLRNLLYHSRRLTAFKARAQGVMEAVEELLDNGQSLSVPERGRRSSINFPPSCCRRGHDGHVPH